MPSLRERFPRQARIALVVAALLATAGVVGSVVQDPEPPPDVKVAFERAVVAEQKQAASPGDGGAEDFRYSRVNLLNDLAEVTATVTLWTDDGSGRVETDEEEKATLTRDDDGTWSVEAP